MDEPHLFGVISLCFLSGVSINKLLGSQLRYIYNTNIDRNTSKTFTSYKVQKLEH